MESQRTDRIYRRCETEPVTGLPYCRSLVVVLAATFSYPAAARILGVPLTRSVSDLVVRLTQLIVRDQAFMILVFFIDHGPEPLTYSNLTLYSGFVRSIGDALKCIRIGSYEELRFGLSEPVPEETTRTYALSLGNLHFLQNFNLPRNLSKRNSQDFFHHSTNNLCWVVDVSGLSGPRTFFLISSALRYRGSAAL